MRGHESQYKVQSRLDDIKGCEPPKSHRAGYKRLRTCSYLFEPFLAHAVSFGIIRTSEVLKTLAVEAKYNGQVIKSLSLHISQQKKEHKKSIHALKGSKGGVPL